MRNKGLIISVIVIIALVGFIMITKSIFSKGKNAKPQQAALAGKNLAAAQAKKIIPKGKGALTVKILNSKKAEVPIRLKAFKAVDKDSSVYIASFVAGRMQELAPGDYDIEIDSIPQKIYKGIRVVQGKETVEDLGCLTGSIYIKTLNSKKLSAYYPIRILYPKSGEMVTAYMTNKALEITPGVYDIEIGTSPRQYKKNVKVEAGKEAILDLGCVTGTLTVKTFDEDKKEVRQSVKISRSDNNEMVSSSLSNRPLDLAKGKYNIEVLSTPRQSRKGVDVKTGEESVIEFTVNAPAVAQKAASSQKHKVSARQPVKVE